MTRQRVIPLSLVAEGEKVRIISLNAGLHMRNRLLEIGIKEGETIQVIQNSYGPVIIALKGSRYAIGRGVSMKILTEIEDNSEVRTCL